MSSVEGIVKDWSETFANPPKLNQNQTIAVNLLSVVFLVMAVLQVLDFNQFKDILSNLGLSSNPATWATALVLTEVWTALALMGIRMHGLLRFFGAVFAVFASGFWLVMSLQTVINGAAGLTSAGFFGKYLTQSPGWWTVIEAAVLFFWTLYALEVTKK